MINFATIITLIFSFLASLYYNLQARLKNDEDGFPSDTIVDTLLTFIVLYGLFLQGYITRTYIILLLLALLLAVAYIRFINENAFHKYDELLETPRNNVVLFLRTLGLFFVFLTIFRFQHVVLQVTLSVVIVLLLNYIALHFKDEISNFFEWVKLQFSIASFGTAAIVWIIVGLIIGQFIFLNYPMPQLKNSLNLNDNIPYFRYEDYSPTLINNQKFSVSEEYTIDIDTLDIDTITHFHDTDDVIYLYDGRIRNNETLYILNKANHEVQEISISDTQGSTPYPYGNAYSRVFYVIDDSVILFGHHGIWEITTDDNTSLRTINSNILDTYDNVFYHNDYLHYYVKTGEDTYDIHQYQNNSFTQVDSLDLENLPYDSLITISDTLFYETADNYYLYADTTVSYDKTNHFVSYAQSTQTMYSANYKEVSNETIFTIQSPNDTVTKSIRGKQNWISFSANGYGYFIPSTDDINHVDVVNASGDHIAYIDTYEPKQFFPNLIDYKKELTHVSTTSDGITYILSSNIGDSEFVVGHINYHNVDLPLTLYGSMSFTHLLIGLIGLIIPFSDITKHMTVVGFKEMTKTKKDDNNDNT